MFRSFVRMLRRRAELRALERQITANQLSIPGATMPAQRGVRTVLRHKPARIAATVAAAGMIFFGGTQLGEYHANQQHIESLSQEHERLMSETAGLSDAYRIALREELRERGIEDKKGEFMGIPNIKTPAPKQADTLAIRDELEQSEERRWIVWNQLSDMD